MVAYHNGEVFIYKAGNIPFTSNSFDEMVDNYKNKSYNEYEAIIETSKYYEEFYGISWRKL